MASLRIVRPGLLTTIQDLGRWGHQSDGVPVAGPMDAFSHRLANRLVSNDDSAAAMEITLIGPEVEALGDVTCAVAGAQFEMSTAEGPVPFGRAFELKSGSRLRFGARLAGARAALAVRGGIDVPSLLGSRATSVISRMGPFDGRPVAAGDLLPIGRSRARPDAPIPTALALPRGGARLRAIPGPQDALFGTAAVERFFAATYTITPASNRMGYRLEGEPIVYGNGGDMLSEATPLGSVQVPKSGQPILLMADRQTTGGYPKIATVITADTPLAAQLAPGDWIRFARCTRAEAVDALVRLDQRFTGRRS